MFFKIIGIYVTCVEIHNIFTNPNVPKFLKEFSKEVLDIIKNGEIEETEKKPKEDKSESAFVHHVVKNRIGF